MKNVQFETGKATLKQESNKILDQLVSIMAQYPAYSLAIAGHTDNVGSADANQVLSEQRAKSCYQYLVSKGVNPVRLSFSGYGESQPIAENGTAEGRRLNRRVEFHMRIE
jgi:OmpA-OmpF porin, OOP family